MRDRRAARTLVCCLESLAAPGSCPAGADFRPILPRGCASRGRGGCQVTVSAMGNSCQSVPRLRKSDHSRIALSNSDALFPLLHSEYPRTVLSAVLPPVLQGGRNSCAPESPPYVYNTVALSPNVAQPLSRPEIPERKSAGFRLAQCMLNRVGSALRELSTLQTQDGLHCVR